MKVVVFTQRVEVVESYNERRDCADQRIAEFIKSCGFLPIPVPNDERVARDMVKTLKPEGIVLTGGNSLLKYGGNAPERDKTDCALIEVAVRTRIPLYGFCRGMQSILDYFGNDLVQVSGHVAVRHRIKDLDNTIEVNSYHNQGCVELKCNMLEILMRSEDGVIEMIKHNELPIIGTMWHPEREDPFKKTDIHMAKTLFGGTE